MGHDATWDDVTSLEQRVGDGVVAVTQANYNARRAPEQEQVCTHHPRGTCCTIHRCPSCEAA
eukprot:scaffold10297_cov113-Isochrysis_galbana.AAC.21